MPMSSPIEDKRKHPRFRVAVRVEVELPDGGVQILRTRDMCENGVFLEAGEAPLPPLGSRVWLRILDSLGGDEAAPRVAGQVVRVDDEGIGVQFEA